MVGINKVKFIKDELKIINFDYIGNSKKDLPIWKYCKKIIHTNATSNLKKIINKSNLDVIEVKENFN